MPSCLQLVVVGALALGSMLIPCMECSRISLRALADVQGQSREADGVFDVSSVLDFTGRGHRKGKPNREGRSWRRKMRKRRRRRRSWRVHTSSRVQKSKMRLKEGLGFQAGTSRFDNPKLAATRSLVVPSRKGNKSKQHKGYDTPYEVRHICDYTHESAEMKLCTVGGCANESKGMWMVRAEPVGKRFDGGSNPAWGGVHVTMTSGGTYKKKPLLMFDEVRRFFSRPKFAKKWCPRDVERTEITCGGWKEKQVTTHSLDFESHFLRQVARRLKSAGFLYPRLRNYHLSIDSSAKAESKWIKDVIANEQFCKWNLVLVEVRKDVIVKRATMKMMRTR